MSFHNGKLIGCVRGNYLNLNGVVLMSFHDWREVCFTNIIREVVE